MARILLKRIENEMVRFFSGWEWKMRGLGYFVVRFFCLLDLESDTEYKW